MSIKKDRSVDLSFFGADSRIRTDDLLITNELLYQLSHISKAYCVSANTYNIIILVENAFVNNKT